MSLKRWTRTRLLPDGGVETAFCCGNSIGHGEACLTLSPGCSGPRFAGRVIKGKDQVIQDDLDLMDAEVAWIKRIREGQLAIVLFAAAREIRKRYLCSSNT